jgi:hypothetical protein
MIHESVKTQSKTLARDAERQRRRELETKWNRIEKRSLPPTLTEAAKRWLEKRAGLASNTLETYKAALKHVRASLGTMLVCEIEARDIVTYQKARLAQKAAGATINKEIACLSAILGDWCLGAGATRRKEIGRERRGGPSSGPRWGEASARASVDCRAAPGKLDSALHSHRPGIEYRNAAQGNQNAQVEEFGPGESSPQGGRE